MTPSVERDSVPIASLKPAKYNPRRIDASSMAALEKSIDRFGLVQEIVVNRRNMTVIGGHQRLKVLKLKGVTNVPVAFVDVDDANEKALNVALNSPSLFGEFTADLDALLDEIAKTNEQLFAELRLGDLYLNERALEEPFGGDLDEAPAPPANPVTEPGDVWMLGRHRLVCGDCTDAHTVARLLGEEKVDILLTDPPYGVDYSGGGNRKRIENDAGVEGGYRKWFASWLTLIPWAEYATFYVFMSDRESYNFRNALESLGYSFGALLAWVKNSPVFGRADYAFRHELITYGWPERHRFYAAGKPTTVLEYGRPQKSELHPTMKPVALLEELLRHGSAAGAVVLDGFGGSGSTLIACEASHRKARLVEIDAAYCDVIVQRWEALTKRKAVLEQPPSESEQDARDDDEPAQLSMLG